MDSNQLKSELYIYLMYVMEAVDLLKNTSNDKTSPLIEEGQKAIEALKFLIEFIR